MENLLQTSGEEVMRKHAKSFYLASLFFPPALMTKVKSLYALCRWLDDAVDESSCNEEAQKNLAVIEEDLLDSKPHFPVNQVYRENGLNPEYIRDLIQGAKDDMKLVRIKTTDELIQYCYKVAGTVGLAMFDLMKVDTPQARPHAVDLGIAMQITNICRDIKEDLNRNRIYIPEEILNFHNLTPQCLINGNYTHAQLSAVTNELLVIGDIYYKSARSAFQHIPWRARGAIMVASSLYQGIGHKLVRQGGNPMNGRVYLSKFEKLTVVLKTLPLWLFSTIGSKRQLLHNHRLHYALTDWSEKREFKH